MAKRAHLLVHGACTIEIILGCHKENGLPWPLCAKRAKKIKLIPFNCGCCPQRRENLVLGKSFQCTFAMGQYDRASRATIELVMDTEATQVTVTYDEWAQHDPTYVACSDGWPRSLLETGKTFQPHRCQLDWFAMPSPPTGPESATD